MIDTIIQHAQTAVQILLAAHALALLIVNLTPTPKDDAALAKFYRAVEFLAGIITKLAKK
jgi:hypothetical protein